jgi:hypothetical protein
MANKRPTKKTSKTASKQLRSKRTSKAARTTAGYTLGDTPQHRGKKIRQAVSEEAGQVADLGLRL